MGTWRKKPVLALRRSSRRSSADRPDAGTDMQPGFLCLWGSGRSLRMCGIIGYVGSRASKQLLINGLERLENRGYDSAGIALMEKDGLDYVRAVGNLANLKVAAGPNGSVATTGLGHTRWATHGAVNEDNAHPLTGCDDSRLAVVLNGIIENYLELKGELQAAGHKFSSETDAEVVAHLLEDTYDGDLVAAARAV